MIELADDNFTGEPGVTSEDLAQAAAYPWGPNLDTDLHPIRDRAARQSGDNWSTLKWATIREGRIYYKPIGLAPELPPSWATHIYKLLPL